MFQFLIPLYGLRFPPKLFLTPSKFLCCCPHSTSVTISCMIWGLAFYSGHTFPQVLVTVLEALPLSPDHASLGFPGGSDGKESACNAGGMGSIPGSGRSPGEGHGSTLQYACLENSMDRGAWGSTVHGFAKNWTRLSDQHLHFFHLLAIQLSLNN